MPDLVNEKTRNPLRDALFVGDTCYTPTCVTDVRLTICNKSGRSTLFDHFTDHLVSEVHIKMSNYSWKSIYICDL